MAQKPYSELRLLLAIIAAVKILAAVLLLFFPAWVLGFFPDVTPDTAHQYLLWGIATICLVFAFAALLALLQPLRNRGIVTVLAVDHFAIFIFDLIILVRGAELSWLILLPEMIYALVISVLLVHYFPVADYSAELRETANELMGQVKKNLKKTEPESGHSDSETLS